MSPRPKKVIETKTETVSTAEIAYAEAQVRAKPEPDPIVEKAVQVLVAAPPCALEHAPVGAKCVVSRDSESGKKVRLLSPDGVIELPVEDIFYTLPAGAKVRKVNEVVYEAYHLGQKEGPIFTAKSARDAVTLFLKAVA